MGKAGKLATDRPTRTLTPPPRRTARPVEEQMLPYQYETQRVWDARLEIGQRVEVRDWTQWVLGTVVELEHDWVWVQLDHDPTQEWPVPRFVSISWNARYGVFPLDLGARQRAQARAMKGGHP